MATVGQFHHLTDEKTEVQKIQETHPRTTKLMRGSPFRAYPVKACSLPLGHAAFSMHMEIFPPRMDREEWMRPYRVKGYREGNGRDCSKVALTIKSNEWSC